MHKSLYVNVSKQEGGWGKTPKIWYCALVMFPKRILQQGAAGYMFKDVSKYMGQIHLYCWLCSITNGQLMFLVMKLLPVALSRWVIEERKKKNPQTKLNVDFDSHVASKSEFPLPAVIVIISLFVRVRMLLLVCIWGLVKKCILCPLEQREMRGAVSYCFCVFLKNTATQFCSVDFFSCRRLQCWQLLLSVCLSSLCPLSHRGEMAQRVWLAAVPVEKLSGSIWTCFVCMDFQRKEGKKEFK